MRAAGAGSRLIDSCWLLWVEATGFHASEWPASLHTTDRSQAGNSRRGGRTRRPSTSCCDVPGHDGIALWAPTSRAPWRAALFVGACTQKDTPLLQAWLRTAPYSHTLCRYLHAAHRWQVVLWQGRWKGGTLTMTSGRSWQLWPLCVEQLLLESCNLVLICVLLFVLSAVHLPQMAGQQPTVHSPQPTAHGPQPAVLATGTGVRLADYGRPIRHGPGRPRFR